MASTPPPSRPTSVRPSSAPAGVPSSNGKYIGLAVLLLGGVAAVVGWKTCQKPPPPVVVQAVVDAGPPAQTISDDDIPLPEVVEDSGPADAGPVKKVVAAASNVCERKCNGSASPELQNALAFRARQARRCYESALAQDPTLHGKITLALKIGSNGQACSASVASNDMDSPNVANCVVDRYRSAAFPAPKGGCVEVNIPVNFVPNK